MGRGWEGTKDKAHLIDTRDLQWSSGVFCVDLKWGEGGGSPFYYAQCPIGRFCVLTVNN